MKKSTSFFSLFSIILFLFALPLSAAILPDPNAYHWEGQGQFYEGWYFKVSDPATQKSFLFLYGVLNPDGESPHSHGFVIVGNGTDGIITSIHQRYDVEDFSASYDCFDTWVGSENHASGVDSTCDHLEGHVSDGINECSWDIDLNITARWQHTMGWLELMPNLQTYWYVHAMNATATGWILWNSEYFEFENILGYQGKNWGEEFPETWYWLQANHFDDPNACCLSASGGTVPLGPKVIEGCMIGFRYDGELYTFRFPQNGTYMNYDIEPGSWHIEARKLRYKIIIDARCDIEDMINLLNPTENGMQPLTWEALVGHIRVRLYERVRLQWVELTDTTSDLAGLEVGGEESLSLRKIFSGNPKDR